MPLRERLNVVGRISHNSGYQVGDDVDTLAEYGFEG